MSRWHHLKYQCFQRAEFLLFILLMPTSFQGLGLQLALLLVEDACNPLHTTEEAGAGQGRLWHVRAEPLKDGHPFRWHVLHLTLLPWLRGVWLCTAAQQSGGKVLCEKENWVGKSLGQELRDFLRSEIDFKGHLVQCSSLTDTQEDCDKFAITELEQGPRAPGRVNRSLHGCHNLSLKAYYLPNNSKSQFCLARGSIPWWESPQQWFGDRNVFHSVAPPSLGGASKLVVGLRQAESESVGSCRRWAGLEVGYLTSVYIPLARSYSQGYTLLPGKLRT